MNNETTRPVIDILGVSHVDHGLDDGQLIAALNAVVQSGAVDDITMDNAHVVIMTVELPEGLGTVPCGLHGPIMGDEPVPTEEVEYEVRGDRKGESRVCARPPRQVREVSVIIGPHEDKPLVLYTAFGGPIAPREPFELEGEEREESCVFWNEHALWDGKL